MPEHQTWFKFLPGYEWLRAATEGRLGETWYAHQTLDIQHVLGSLLAVLILVVLGGLAYGKIRDAKAAVMPEAKLTIRTFFELIAEMTLGQMEAMMGRREARMFLPLIGTCAFFILLSNSMGMLPGFGVPTSNLNTTLACAIVTVFSAEVYGFVRHGFGYLKEFFGPLNRWYHFFTFLPIIIFVVEVIGHLARLVSLSIRLMGNMYADHTVVGVFVTLVPFVPVLVPLPVQLLGVLVVVVQTVVFCLLSIVYIALAIGEEEHGEDHAEAR